MPWRVEQLGRDHDAVAVWDRYVLESPTASGYHLTAWRSVIERAFGHQTIYLVARDDNSEVGGVLPLVVLNSRLFGRFMVSLPYFTYGGLDAKNDTAQRLLSEAAVEQARLFSAEHVELRQTRDISLAWRVKTEKVSMRLPLPPEFDTLLKGFPAKLRSQIRRPGKEGMVAQIGGIELLDQFYRVFARNMRDLGTPVYAKQFFKTILEIFPKETAIVSIVWRGQPTAAAFLYTFRQVMEIPWASSDARYNRFSPNMLLYSTVLEYACRQGCHVFDFGRCTLGSGTYRFKQQWGSQAHPLYWYYWLGNNVPLPQLNPHNPRYRLAISAWRRLPVFVANMVGPRIVKYLP